MNELTPSHILERLAERWHSGVSPEGDAEIARWIEEDPAHAERVQELQRIWASHHMPEMAADVQRALRRIHAMVESAPPGASAGGQRPTSADGLTRFTTPRAAPFGRPVWAAMSVAAVALVVLFGSLLFGPHRPSYGAGAAMATYVTAKGERARIELSDGTIVELNVDSRLVIPEHFGDRSRTVRLTGEADFRVAHTAGMPFTIEAAGTRTTVLGTEFGVRAYPRTDVQVAVRTGKVAIGSAVLTAGDVAKITPGALRIAHAQDVDAALGFAEGRLVLHDVPLRDAITDLNRWYDVAIRLGTPALGDEHINATLLNGSVRDLMDNLQAIFGVRIERNGRTLTLYPKGAE